MGQINDKLRSVQNGIGHWCPGCEEMHVITNSWSFDGNFDSPTFNPSVKITGKQTIKVNGKWVGDWVRDINGNVIDFCCHYFLHNGNLQFCNDSTHLYAGKTIPLQSLPIFLQDE